MNQCQRKYNGKKHCSKLCELCLDALLPLLDDVGKFYKWTTSPDGPLDKLAGEITEALMLKIYQEKGIWKESMMIFLTPNVRTIIIPWDRKILLFAQRKCKALKQILIDTKVSRFNKNLLDILQPNINVLDFSGELIYRGKGLPNKQLNSWLAESSKLLRSMEIASQYQISYLGGNDYLTEIDFGDINMTTEDIAKILKTTPNLRLLRHYKLTAAIVHLHCKNVDNEKLQNAVNYKLTNIDADFSHVGQNDSEKHFSVLPIDALKITVQLCPNANDIRLRFDCSTYNDVALPLVDLNKIVKFSAVCVTSGERSCLDFTDLTPVLNKHGNKFLTHLELKVIEEVDTHSIVQSCPKLEHLVLSGCGIVAKPCNHSNPYKYKMKYLKRLFYIDGDDFSWDHAVPQCFWMATLLSDSKINSLEGLFLESPRLSEEMFDNLLNSQIFENLKIFSVSSVSEINLEKIQLLLKIAPNLNFVRISQCEQITSRHAVWIRSRLGKGSYVTVD